MPSDLLELGPRRDKVKQIAQIRTDFQVSIAKLSRNVCYHGPKLIIGEGQGALIALGFARPYVLELSLQTRNVQRQEAQRIGEAWGQVTAVVGISPRLFRGKGLMPDLLEPGIRAHVERNAHAGAPRLTNGRAF